MSDKNQAGFSLIELLIVFVIMGVLAGLTFPYVKKAKGAAEDGNAFASMKTMVATQYSFYTQHGRYARLDEINNSQYGVLGRMQDNVLTRGSYTFQMSPDPQPSDEQLRNGFMIVGTRPVGNGELPVVLTVTDKGHTENIF